MVFKDPRTELACVNELLEELEEVNKALSEARTGTPYPWKADVQRAIHFLSAIEITLLNIEERLKNGN